MRQLWCHVDCIVDHFGFGALALGLLLMPFLIHLLLLFLQGFDGCLLRRVHLVLGWEVFLDGLQLSGRHCYRFGRCLDFAGALTTFRPLMRCSQPRFQRGDLVGCFLGYA